MPMPPHSLHPDALISLVPTLRWCIRSARRALYRALCLAPLALMLWSGPSTGQADAATPRRPFPQHVQYAPGSIRPDHRTQNQLDDDVRNLYAAWKSRYLSQAGTTGDGHPRYRVKIGRDSSEATVSEGQGFGMIITALMAGHDTDAQTIFDGLWEFSRDHPSSIDSRLMDFWVEADEGPDPYGDDSAFDGDADMAYALLLAEQQWGNDGRFDYRAQALQVLQGVLESTIGPQSRLPMLGDWVVPDGTPYSQHSPRSSDFMPEHFRSFFAASGSSAWLDVVTASQTAIELAQLGYSPATGLLPDFFEPVSPSDPNLRPASPDFLAGPNDGFYYYNALRVPFRIGVDALLSGDLASRLQARRIGLWARSATSGDPLNLNAGYRLDGSPLPGGGYFTTAFAAPLGVAALLEPAQQAWLNAIYDAVRQSDESYYEDSISLLCLLVMTGNFWSPTAYPDIPIPGLPPAATCLLAALLLAGALHGLGRR
jgi:endo-1,4-beta-D-glucanase Y